MLDKRFETLFQKFNFLHITKNAEVDQQIFEKINKSKVIIIDTYYNSGEEYIISCFDKQLTIFEKSNQDIIQTFFSRNNEDKIYSVPKTQKYNQINSNLLSLNKKTSLFDEEISNFKKIFVINHENNNEIKKFWQIILPCLSAYLIKDSYIKNRNDRTNIYLRKTNKNTNLKTYQENEFIELRTISSSNFSTIHLYYHIKDEKLFVVKNIYNPYEINKLIQREISNYESINYSSIPRFYGKVSKNNNYSIVIEYIESITFDNLKNIRLNFKLKNKIIIEILYIFQYLHQNRFVYRDLKPNNLILDYNQKVVLIDFDRMIKEDYCMETTKDLNSIFVDPRVLESESILSVQNDIYSIGCMIYYILKEDKNNKNFKIMNNIDDVKNDKEFKNKYPIIFEIVEKCLKKDPYQRPSKTELITFFY